MISRVAENCFWLNRYVERAETTARLVSINRLVILDSGIQEARRWKPIIVVVGEQQRFESLVGTRGYDKDEEAEEYLTWSKDNPVSIRSSLAGARENARMTREVISREMWETLNTAWQWFNSPAARKEYKKDRAQFYMRIRRTCAEFQGDCHDTMLHDEPFNFMRLGIVLERASQTARVMDVKHHWSEVSEQSDLETAQQSAQWMGLLRLCAAVEPFFKRYSSAPTGPLVMRFILQDMGFPRSVTHCLDRARNFIERIESGTKRRSATATKTLIQSAGKRMRTADVSSMSHAELHDELTHVTEMSAKICEQLYVDFFDPALPASRRAAR